jgi:CheY-like chemotaxis protein/HPt (histidine-containing phosphotransfer) domain-containing protein
MLLNDILDFSKIEAGALELENIAFNVTEVAQMTANLLRPQAGKKNIDLIVDCESNSPHYIWGDSGRIRQIIMNLLGNAIKFTERGHVRLKVDMQDNDQQHSLYVSVQDTGMGIPSHKIHEIFDKFTQADASVTRKFGGTGLGLAITRHLVNLMGGEIGVESAEGKGSTFWFTIPCKPADASDQAFTIEQLRIITHTDTVKMPIGDARALLVDDYHVNQIFAEKLLRKFGFQHIDKAEDGFEAMLKCNENQYDIIFMDCQMPKMDGYITTQEIRAREVSGSGHTPIVAMTANAMMGDREKCLNAGMDDYLSKPLRAEHLKKILQTWFILDGNKAAISPNAGASIVQEDRESPVDMEQLRMFTDGDVAEEKALATLFLDQAAEMIVLLENSTSADKKEIWKSAAHRFKGSSGNLGAMKLHNLCKHAEMQFGDKEADKLEMLMSIKFEMERVGEFFGTSP